MNAPNETSDSLALARILVTGSAVASAPDSVLVGTLALLLDGAKSGSGVLKAADVARQLKIGVAALKSAVAGSPFVAAEGECLLLPRYAAFAGNVRDFFAGRLALPQAPASAPEQQALADLFPATAGFNDADQRAAILGLLHAPAGLLSGGPGTGKTTTAAALLALRARLDSELKPEQVLLSAPTGKAAQRLQASLHKAARRLALDARERDFLGQLRPATLHKALGWTPKPPEQGGPFRHGASRPLPQDIILVDEASMVDLALMARLLRAVKPGAQLFLLGDHDQLESVEVGGVLAGLVRRADADHFVFRLRENYRSKDAPHIMGWAALARPGAPAGVAEFLAEAQKPGAENQIRWLPCAHPLRDRAVLALCRHAWEGWRARFADLHAGADAASIAGALEALGDFQLLVATNADREQANAAGLAVMRQGAAGARRDVEQVPHGTPVMVLANHHPLDLSNGDVGLALGVGGGAPASRVYFPGREEPVPMADMPAHGPAFALTIHKSQGSEWKQVVIALPAFGGELLTRNLLYTAITRAGRQVTLAGDAGALERVMGG